MTGILAVVMNRRTEVSVRAIKIWIVVLRRTSIHQLAPFKLLQRSREQFLRGIEHPTIHQAQSDGMACHLSFIEKCGKCVPSSIVSSRISNLLEIRKEL